MEWTDQMGIGNESIDSEHRNLISLTNNVIRAIQTRSSSGLAQAFDQLEQDLCLHFASEREIAQAINFDFSHHELAQQYMLGELQFLKGLLDAKNCLWFSGAIEHFTRFLKNWVIDNHIIMMNMRMKPTLQNHSFQLHGGKASVCAQALTDS